MGLATLKGRTKIQKLKLTTIFYPQTSGGFTAICPELRGCTTQGKTYEEAKTNIIEAISLCLEEDSEKEDLLEAYNVGNKIFSEVEIII